MPIYINSFIIFLFFIFLWGVKQLSFNYKLLLLGIPFGKIKELEITSFFEYFSVLFYFCYNSDLIQFFVRACLNNFYYNEFYNFLSNYAFLHAYKSIFINFDKGTLESLGPTGLSIVYQKFSSIAIR